MSAVSDIIEKRAAEDRDNALGVIALAKVIGLVTIAVALIVSLAAASHEQATGIDHVNLAVTQMDSTTQQNAALVEESTSASKAMEAQAESLMRQMSFFSVQSAGSEASRGAAHSPGTLRSYPTHSGRTSTYSTPTNPASSHEDLDHAHAA